MKLNFRCIAHPGLPTIALGMREIEVSLGFESIFWSFISKLGMTEFGDKGVFTFNTEGNAWTIQHVQWIYLYTELICDCGINGEGRKWTGNDNFVALFFKRVAIAYCVTPGPNVVAY